MKLHGNPRTCPKSRRLLVERQHIGDFSDGQELAHRQLQIEPDITLAVRQAFKLVRLDRYLVGDETTSR